MFLFLFIEWHLTSSTILYSYILGIAYLLIWLLSPINPIVDSDYRETVDSGYRETVDSGYRETVDSGYRVTLVLIKPQSYVPTVITGSLDNFQSRKSLLMDANFRCWKMLSKNIFFFQTLSNNFESFKFVAPSRKYEDYHKNFFIFVYYC